MKHSTNRDEGAVLLIALFVLVLGSTVVAATMSYAMAVTRNADVRSTKLEAVQAAKAGLRVALADPLSLFSQCASAGLTVSVPLADAGMGSETTTTCTKVDEARSERPGYQRVAVATTQASILPPVSIIGQALALPAGSSLKAWQDETTPTPTDGKIWMPNLPSRVIYRRSSVGWRMPAGFPSCTVYFPGTYPNAITINSSTPTYFASGVYYFEKQVRITGKSRVVVGGGPDEGCTTDQEAAFYATNAPTVHGISGLGATFVFGAEGRLTIDTLANGTETSVIFNERYVSETDQASAPSAGVSIISVNGAITGNGSSSSVGTPLLLADSLSVPLSKVGLTNPVDATTNGYVPSTLVPSLPINASDKPIVEIDLTSPRPTTVRIPGAVAVPQGLIEISVANAAAANKTVEITGGVLAANIIVTPTTPSTYKLGLVAPIVQRTFKITTVSPGSPGSVANAIVQVNQNGAFAVNSWEVR